MKPSKHSLITRRDFMKDTTIAAAASAFAAGIRPVTAEASETKENDNRIFTDIYRQLHIDSHFGGFKDIYRNFDAEACAQAFDDAGFQMVSYFSKCWAGYSYYPTKYGTVHPGIERDFTGELTRALQKRGIRCILYYMLGMERKHQKKHPGWIRNTDSTKALFDESAIAAASMMCFRSPYVDEIGIPQMKELIRNYNPDGFFVDIVIQQFLHSVCYCNYCREQFARDVGGEIPKSDDDPKSFAYRLWANKQMEAFITKLHYSLAEEKPDINIINNYTWMMRYPVTPPKFVNHITWDTPVPKVGHFSSNFSLEARYVSSLPDVTWSVMNTRGATWGEYSLREPEAFMSECATLLASCGRTYLSDIPYPHGNPDPAVMEVFGSVNRRTKELEPYLKDCRPVKDVAVLHSADSIWSKSPLVPTPEWVPGPAYYSVCGAHKALTEGHVQMGILNSDLLPGQLGDYNALVLPDQRILTEPEIDAIKRFVSEGGMLLATGETGTRDTENNLLKNFSIADVLGVQFIGPAGTANSYLRVKDKNKQYGIPAMDIQAVGSYARIKTTTAKTLLELVPPFEGIKNGTPPPSLSAEGPGVTINSYGKGKAVYCAPQLFNGYYVEATPVLRKLALWMLDLVCPGEKRTIVCENTPINVEMFYNTRRGERFVHLVNYSGDKREVGTPQVQDFTTVHGITVSMRLERKPKSITLVP
ncbi:alpha-L-fucosidase, partial [Candidatus Latescibacterota bacterium]